MKNFRQYILAGMAILVLTACSSNPVQEPEQKTTPEPVAQTFTQDIVMPSTASEKLVTLSQLQTSIATVEKSASWLSIESQAYSSGSPQIKLCSTDNTERVERKCNVTITASSGDKVVLSVTQQGTSEGTGIDDLHNSQTDKPAYRRQ